MHEETILINSEYDYSNIIPTIECVSYLVQYGDSVYTQFLSLLNQEEEKNTPLKYEYREYMYKKHYSTEFEIFIREKTYHNITCKNYEEFLAAVQDNNLKNVDKLEIKLNLTYQRGKEGSFVDYENLFHIFFSPYDIKFARKSNHSETNMNRIEDSIKKILESFPKTNTIFYTKD